MINLAFRLDDPSKSSNHQLESEIIRLLEKHRIPATFGVIPYLQEHEESAVALTKKDVNHLIDAQKKGIIEIALHGYSHTTNSLLNTNSEFVGHSFDKQEQLIKMGRDLLESIFMEPVHGFVPPWNSYDENTVHVLQHLQFQYLSADWNSTGLNQPIALIPHTCNLPHLKIAVEEARLFKKSAIIPILHHYDFKEHSADTGITDLNEFSELLNWINSQTDIHTSTLNEISKMYLPSELQKPIKFYERFKNSHWRIRQLMPQYSLNLNKNWSFNFSLSRIS